MPKFASVTGTATRCTILRHRRLQALRCREGCSMPTKINGALRAQITLKRILERFGLKAPLATVLQHLLFMAVAVAKSARLLLTKMNFNGNLRLRGKFFFAF